MEKVSKIKHVEMLQEWSNAHGTYHPHKVTFENGDIAIANKKKQNAYSVDQELKYEITGQDKSGNNKFKEVKEEFTPGGSKTDPKTQTYIIKQSSLTRAIEHLSIKKIDFKKEDVIKLAQYYTDWVLKE